MGPSPSGVEGWQHLSEVVLVDQSSLGKTPRSNPVVYIGAFEDIRELFAQAGNVETVRIITDQFTGRPRGFGFVEMTTKDEAVKAVEMLNGRLFRDRNLVVDEARPQPQRGAGGPRPDRGPRTGGAPGGGWRR